jgi:hypothetical protein
MTLIMKGASAPTTSPRLACGCMIHGEAAVDGAGLSLLNQNGKIGVRAWCMVMKQRINYGDARLIRACVSFSL